MVLNLAAETKVSLPLPEKKRHINQYYKIETFLSSPFEVLKSFSYWGCLLTFSRLLHCLLDFLFKFYLLLTFDMFKKLLSRHLSLWQMAGKRRASKLHRISFFRELLKYERKRLDNLNLFSTSHSRQLLFFFFAVKIKYVSHCNFIAEVLLPLQQLKSN